MMDAVLALAALALGSLCAGTETALLKSRLGLARESLPLPRPAVSPEEAPPRGPADAVRKNRGPARKPPPTLGAAALADIGLVRTGRLVGLTVTVSLLVWYSRQVQAGPALLALSLMVLAWCWVIGAEAIPRMALYNKAHLALRLFPARRLSSGSRLMATLMAWVLAPGRRLALALEKRAGLSSPGLDAEQVRRCVALALEAGAIDTREGRLLDSVMDFSEALVKEVMVPRRDIVSVHSEATLEDTLRVVDEYAFSRLPVHQGDTDNIVGILHLKDLLDYLRSTPPPDFDVRHLARPPLFIPGVMTLEQTLQEFRRRNTHLALVVDEYGGTSGLVTLEDVLEEIFGEIRDEHDEEEEETVLTTAASSLVLDARAELKEVEEVMKIRFPEVDCETLAGFVFNSLGHLPQEHEAIEYGGFRFEVTRMEGRRIAEVLVERSGPAAGERKALDESGRSSHSGGRLS